MSKKRQQLLATALGILTSQSIILASESAQAAVPKKGEKPANCFGINTCKGKNGCNLNASQIELSNKVYANKFSKSVPIDCAGFSDCSSQSGHLAWISKKSEKECFDEGGFVFEKKDGNILVIRDKTGEKK